MKIRSLSRKQRYGIAVLSVIAAALLRGWLEWFLRTDLPVLFFIVPVIVAGWYGGLWPGLLATGLSLLFGDLLLLLPRGSIFRDEAFFDAKRLLVFAFTGMLVSILCAKARQGADDRLECLERFKIFVESVPGYAILITDSAGRIRCWNTAAERMTGYSEKEVLGHDLSMISPEKTSHEEAQRALEIARTVGYCEREGWQMRKDSSRFWASEVVAALRNQAGQMCGVAKIMRDMTEHKLADEATERSENFVRNMVDVSPSLMYIFDIEQETNVFINRSAAEVLGYVEAQVRAPGFLSSVMDPADWGPFLDHVRRLGGLQANESADFEYRMRHRDGAWRWFHSRDKVFTRNADGRAREIVGAATDITERKNAEEKLKESDDRYRAFIANSSEGIWRYEMDEPVPVTLPADEQIELLYHRGYLAECNEVFASSHGYASVDEILGQRLTILFVRSDPEKIIEYSRLFVRSGYRLIGVETREVDIHGNTKYFLSNLIGIQKDGKLVRAWGTQRDITAQKQTESALRASEERMRRTTDATQDALWEIDLRTKQLWWSEAARLLFGRSPVELQIGLSDWYDGIDPEDRERVRTKFEEFMSSGAMDWSDEYRFRRADGVYICIHDQGRKFYDARSEPVWIAGAMVDITNRKAAEEALRLSEERFAKAFRASPDALVISRIVDGVIFEVNDSFVEQFGYARDELIGKSTLWLDLYVDPTVRGRALKILEAEGRIRDLKVEVKRKSGEVRLVQFSAEPIDIRGEHCWVTLGKDITERERAEKQREQSLAKEKAAREEAERSNRMKDEFLATISHELRTPLTAIRGWAAILVKDTLPKDQMQHAFEVIERSAESQARLVNDILDMSRFITGRFNLEAGPIEIERIFQDAVDVIRPSAVAKRITLRVESDGEGSMILGDANRVHQILWNIFSNAVKFTDAGGRVDARLMRIGERVEISISDTGIGIEPEFLPHVFDRFRQADSTSTRKYGGLGLGLAIVRYLVEVHGGTVSASSHGKGQGSTFKVDFPVAEMPGNDQPGPRVSKPEYKML